ncbi:MAG: hypothetical protein JWN11_1996 [Hyphomicrobiales bacterium]|nr:hypothetical protein [Hyphomicrobiales bacterium]
MSGTGFVSSDAVRQAFSTAMSRMYRAEVPAYGTLLELVAEVNDAFLAQHAQARADLERTDSLARISDERHGAIRLGTADELSTMRRVFAVMGMAPVGYYDLSVAGIPVHSTAFRPVGADALNKNPFRVFTSLLRLDLVEDQALVAAARAVLAARKIFAPGALDLVAKAERQGGLDQGDAALFVEEVLETFRWHDQALVDDALYKRLNDAHRLIADVVSFRGPHINHLTPRTLDIDAVQRLMPERGIAAKAVIEGPPTRACPILLRQTSFKALEEPVSFKTALGVWQAGSHTARFGEIEQRGIALTRKGRALYDRLLDEVRAGDKSLGYETRLQHVFKHFPDSWDAIRTAGLGYFSYSLTEAGKTAANRRGETGSVEELLQAGLLQADPIVYEDFLPVSAAGIFQSNLGDAAAQQFGASPSQAAFESDLGAPVLDEFEHYRQIEAASIERCLLSLKPHAFHA